MEVADIDLNECNIQAINNTQNTPLLHRVYSICTEQVVVKTTGILFLVKLLLLRYEKKMNTYVK